MWSPTGREIVLTSARASNWNLYKQPVDQSKEMEQIVASGFSKVPSSWSRDGKLLAYTESRQESGQDIFVLSLNGERLPAVRNRSREWSTRRSRPTVSGSPISQTKRANSRSTSAAGLAVTASSACPTMAAHFQNGTRTEKSSSTGAATNHRSGAGRRLAYLQVRHQKSRPQSGVTVNHVNGRMLISIQ